MFDVQLGKILSFLIHLWFDTNTHKLLTRSPMDIATRDIEEETSLSLLLLSWSQWLWKPKERKSLDIRVTRLLLQSFPMAFTYCCRPSSGSVNLSKEGKLCSEYEMNLVAFLAR